MVEVKYQMLKTSHKLVCLSEDFTLNPQWLHRHAKHQNREPPERKPSMYKLVTTSWPQDCHDRNFGPKAGDYFFRLRYSHTHFSDFMGLVKRSQQSRRLWYTLVYISLGQISSSISWAVATSVNPSVSQLVCWPVSSSWLHTSAPANGSFINLSGGQKKKRANITLMLSHVQSISDSFQSF